MRSTVYRTRFLLIPEDVISDDDSFGSIRDALGEIDIDVEPPAPLTEVVADGPLREHLGGLPRPVRLAGRPGRPAADAWVALQYLRSRFAANGGEEGQQPTLADRISLEHLLCGTLLGWGGAPTYDPHGLTDTAAANYAPPPVRAPVELAGEPPWRDPAWDANRRRPVVAVVDTGVRDHPWFGDLSTAATPGHRGFLRLFQPSEVAIAAQEQKVAGLPRSLVLEDSLDAPTTTNPLTDVVNPATGHGTFIAGVIHQHAPEADVLMVRVLHPDNVGLEGDALLALWLLLARIRDARTKNHRDWVDILSLSMGFYDEDPGDGKRSRLAEIIRALVAEGVVVVASAGNDSTERPFLPAALGVLDPPPAPGQPVLGVGALNPNGTTAWFSNGGPSATCYAPGARIVSAFPPDVNGSARPGRYVPAKGREQADLDDFSSGFAVWDGTSFAAPYIAAELANLMLDIGTDAVATREDTTARAAQAVTRLRKNAERR
ncbi:S8/S53 family peptidase [Amycolatopsis sp. Hca4]|uniref:S8 family peptidase n=1 Tax=Amycolatopsis sp. Hca4 TaxID=2742131 RepID=UPI0015926C31|nr:S8/S53 family peptidase [Amycolatopsis sp. Hca4]QKV72452.1 S8/S53 family peptidase [Amycolatopsis sp. Hca4]